MNIDYPRIQEIYESNQSALQKNDLNAFFNGIANEERGMAVTFMIKDLQVNVFDYLTEIPDYLFADTVGILPADIVLPATITKIGVGAFTDSKDIKQVVIESPIKTLESGVFSGSSLVSVTLPNGLVKIDSEAFSECTNLEAVNLPDSVQNIVASAFDSCDESKLSINISEQAFNPAIFKGMKWDENGQPDMNDKRTALYANTIKTV